ncbi:LacI family DNA-binding transcriptional regulator [Pedobacter metabolipauper]|uniref:LacI family transcriptional regulator n=1 Tax=Pedobacter metabolipauper TaxID=425513 RepID=A0A4R6SZF6_9SPHI|nr:LacI family DNA-binding transcriptional regulator [Pedobacter metabolipauper]TDQ11462.1 LacI family transcriptional regulator [Pedobacter metabolipauper]
MKPPSIKDIANKANVSITTVSFILNGKAENMRISKAVIEKVNAIIKEIGFKPNQVARSLRTGNTKTIGLLVEDISNPFFASIARKIEDKAYKKGYKISYSSTENDVSKAKDLIEMFKSRKVDAYIIAPVPGIEDDIRQLQADGIPVVIFDRHIPDLEVNCVVVDNYKGTFEATDYLIERGKKNIGFVTVNVQVAEMKDRLLGYQKALEQHNIEFDASLYTEVPFDSSDLNTNAQLALLFKENPQMDAVLFSTNYLAIKGLGTLKEIGKLMNDDFCVVAYDDHDVFKLHTPPISVVDQPIEEIAERVIDILLQELSKVNYGPALNVKTNEVQKVILLPKFIVR